MRSINSQFCWHCVLPGQRSYLNSAGLGKEFADTKTKELTWYGNMYLPLVSQHKREFGLLAVV